MVEISKDIENYAQGRIQYYHRLFPFLLNLKESPIFNSSWLCDTLHLSLMPVLVPLGSDIVVRREKRLLYKKSTGVSLSIFLQRVKFLIFH